jgi:hypothetical protein
MRNKKAADWPPFLFWRGPFLLEVGFSAPKQILAFDNLLIYFCSINT